MNGRTEEPKSALPFVLAAAIAVGLIAAPVGAQNTADELEEAKARLSKVQREADAATAEYEAARGRLITTQEQIQATEARVEKVERRVTRIRSRVGERAREAYQMGGTGMLELLFESESVSDFSDRVVFLDRLAQADADLVIEARVLSEELDRLQADLDELAERQRETMKVLDDKRDLLFDRLEEAQALTAKLEETLREERAAARRAAAEAAASASRSAPSAPGSTPVVSGGALQACPVPGSSFVDSWGAPRSGGRSHQGVDMMAPYGTPIYAAQPGRMTQSSSSLGGNQAYVYAPNGDMTFYAHLQGYAGGPRTVSAGELIGYVGDTGNATGSPHLHFEYHPGGGGAVNPYPYVRAVC